MTFDPRTVLTHAQTVLSNTNVFTGGVQVGEPLSPPQDMTAALMYRAYLPAGVTLNTTMDLWEFLVRIYARAGMNPTDAATVENNVAYGFSQVLTALAGDFTLGGTVRAISWAGEGGGHIDAKWGHVVISGTIMRVVDLSVPVIVDDASSFVP